jgi:hypothetical protein
MFSIMPSALVGKVLQLQKEITVIAKNPKGLSFIASLPKGAVVELTEAAPFLSPTMLVAQSSDREFLIYERDLSDATVLTESQQVDSTIINLAAAAVA